MADLGEIVNKLASMNENQVIIISRHKSGIYEVVSTVKTPQNNGSTSQNTSTHIDIILVPSSPEYGIINLPEEHKDFFPGYRKQFILETDVRKFVMHLTGANNGTSIGERVGNYLCHPRAGNVDPKLLRECPDANNHIRGSFKRFYEAHKELKPGDKLRIHKVNSEVYRLEIRQ